MYQIEENCEIIQVFESLTSNFEDWKTIPFIQK